MNARGARSVRSIMENVLRDHPKGLLYFAIFGSQAKGAQERLGMEPLLPGERETAAGLTAMRRMVCLETDARVALGGKVDSYAGRMPGVAEEVLLSLGSRPPVFLLGCFGGCARDIAEALGLAGRREGFAREVFWPGRGELEIYGAGDLQNGLSDEENRELAGAPHVGQAIPPMLRGLSRLHEGLLLGGTRSDRRC